MQHKRKGRWFRRLLRLVAGGLLVLLLVSFLFDHFVQFRASYAEMRAFFNKHGIQGNIHYYTSGGRTIRYVSVGGDSLPVVLFIHGAPSSSSLYKPYYSDTAVTSHFRLLAVDRPGYGYSGFGQPEPSIQKQAAMIRPILDSLNTVKHPVIVVGGSYGAPIACRLTMDYPGLVQGLVLVGPSLAPGEEKIFWVSPLIEHPALNWMVPRMFRSANTEKLHHRAELVKLLPRWKEISLPVAYLQGEKDNLVYTSNAAFAKKHLTGVPYLDIHFFKGRGHFIRCAEKPNGL